MIMAADTWGKIYNDDWMKDRGFIEKEKPLAKDIVNSHGGKKLITISQNAPIKEAIEKLTKFNISQIPVLSENEVVGSINDNTLYTKILKDPDLKNGTVEEIMDSPFPIMEGHQPIEEVSKAINKENKAVMIKDANNGYHIITMHDIIDALH